MNQETAISRGAVRCVKAGKVELRAGMTVAQGFETVVASCLHHYRLNEPLVIQHRSSEGLHQTRVALRRLRSAFSLFKPAVADPEFKRLDDELSCLIGATGDARNLDVYLQRGLSAEERRPVEKRRDEAYDAAIAAMNSSHTRRLLADIAAWATDGEWRSQSKARRPLKRFMSRRIDELWKRTCGARRVARMGELRRHHLRIRVKKLRYALDFARGLNQRHKKRRKAFGNALKELQDALGQLNDAVVARRLIVGSQWPIALPPELGERRLLDDANSALKRLRKTGPYW